MNLRILRAKLMTYLAWIMKHYLATSLACFPKVDLCDLLPVCVSVYSLIKF
jgi:hypothetical protein